MYKLKQQKDIVTVVLVTLIGLSVMASTAMVATTLVSQREASVSAHAQTNSELMGWTGVVAFKEYLLAQGDLGLTNITDLAGQNVSLLYDANKKEINVNNIQISGCLAEGLPCTVSAHILSANMAARSATTIEAIYELTVSNGKLQIVKQSANFNFGGNTSFSGSTTIDSEVANADVTMNVDGDLALNLRSEEHTSELQSRPHLVCRLLLEK